MTVSDKTAVGPREDGAARVVRSEGEALELADELARRFAAGAADRDAERTIPLAELDELSASGLLGITVPGEYGGLDATLRTVVEVFRRIAAADPSIAQIPQSHFVYLNVLRENGSEAQKQRFFADVLAGRRFGNAQAEAKSATAQQIVTTATPSGVGDLVLEGKKAYATGALLAHWITVLAKNEDDQQVVAYVPWNAPGVNVIDDWAGMGQRTTASGTVELNGVRISPENVVPHHLTFTRPQLHGAIAQVLHAAIDVGIARNALEEAREFVRTRSRPWGEAGVERASDDPLTIQRFGELDIKLRAAEALLTQAADQIDSSRAALNDESAAEASIAVATAKVHGGEVAVELASALFEVSGTRSSVAETNLNRHWRNARTHTLHDPPRWKTQHVGRYFLNGTLPPRTGQI